MAQDRAAIRQRLRNFDFRNLFVEELGWDIHRASLQAVVSGRPYPLQAVAEKHGLAVYVSESRDGLPDYATRRKIEREAAKLTHEKLIVFADRAKQEQVWQWVKKEPNRPPAYREQAFRAGHREELLIQKLDAIAFDIQEAERLTSVAEVAARVGASFDVNLITKRFYDRFKIEHEGFLGFIKGMAEVADREWYASLMLNRLMFIYFFQRQGFLDSDVNYLRNRLRQVQARRGRDQFHTFYRYFLKRLFHEGLGKREEERARDLTGLLGKVPYLNGGLFDEHQLERTYPGIEIQDRAFENLFDFFDAYDWHLDDRPLGNEREINPDVLGYIFEKYVNQKQMGAYYTKEDITGYMAKSTIVPFLFDAAEEKCAIAFRKDGALWRLLREDPDRYIYEGFRKGVDLPLPVEIGVGVVDLSKRGAWNRAADEAYALPTETWRDHVARRHRCEELRQKLRSGDVHAIDDLVTLNLDVQRFAQDVIENAEGSELVRAFWQALAGRIPESSRETWEQGISVLDPACGSGAFLFAALIVLLPLYEACLQRMQRFVDEAELSVEEHSSAKYRDFREALTRMAQHPNQRYFVLKSIILENLYGVDIMEEAVEICKLRLFLKLVAQLDSVDQIEPLPDIDFNVRAGNTLIGFGTRDDVRHALTMHAGGQMKMLSSADEEALTRIDELAEAADRAFKEFRRQQTQLRGAVTAADKANIRTRLEVLDAELDHLLARQYGVQPLRTAEYERWHKNHQPFQWFVEFYGIMDGGGFDVVIGNPPWKEYAAVRREYTIRGYASEPCGNLHGIFTERASQLRAPGGRMSFIVQLPLANSTRMKSVRDLLRTRSHALWVAPFDDRPGKLFEGLQHCRSVIFLSAGWADGEEPRLATTKYQRWATAARPELFEGIEYAHLVGNPLFADHFPKYASDVETRVFGKVQRASDRRMAASMSPRHTRHFIFYQEATQYWVKATIGLPYYEKNGVVGAPDHGRYLYFPDEPTAQSACAVLNSSLFYSYFIAYGDCFHLSDKLVSAFPVSTRLLADTELPELNRQLMKDLRTNAGRTTIRTRDGDEITYATFYASSSKPILDAIDCVLGKHFGFTEEELDFVLNYDIKYRIGAVTSADDR